MYITCTCNRCNCFLGHDPREKEIRLRPGTALLPGKTLSVLPRPGRVDLPAKHRQVVRRGKNKGVFARIRREHFQQPDKGETTTSAPEIIS